MVAEILLSTQGDTTDAPSTIQIQQCTNTPQNWTNVGSRTFTPVGVAPATQSNSTVARMDSYAPNATVDPAKSPQVDSRGSSNCVIPSLSLTGTSGGTDADSRVAKYKPPIRIFSAVVIVATFGASFYIACLTATTTLLPVDYHQNSRRSFGLGVFAAALSVATAFVSATNAILYSILVGGDCGMPGFLCNPIPSYIACFIFMFGSGNCFILGIYFFLVEFAPFLKVPFVILTVISFILMAGPSIALFTTIFLFVRRTYYAQCALMRVPHDINAI